MSMLLLAGAGLFARSLYNLRAVDPGFGVERMLTFAVNPTLSGYDQPRAQRLFEDLQRQLAAVPGVRSVSMSELGVLAGNSWSMTVRVDGYQSREDENMNPNIDGVGPQFFSTMGVPLVSGREFNDKDAAGAPRVAIVNETMARRYWGNDNPVGRRIGVAGSDPTAVEIVGVVRDIRSQQLREEAPRFVYLPYRQNEELTQLTYYVRASGDPSSIATSVRQTVQRLDPKIPLYDLKTMDVQVAESLFVERMVAALSVAFGALATVLAAIGLYGVMSYAVARRTREIGIRMALGAERRGVLWLVLKEVAVLAVLGVAGGLAAAFYLTRRVESQLFGIAPTDPLTLAAAVVMLLLVALLAGLIPARRATTIDPILALRTE
jgi:predicted permease